MESRDFRGGAGGGVKTRAGAYKFWIVIGQRYCRNVCLSSQNSVGRVLPRRILLLLIVKVSVITTALLLVAIKVNALQRLRKRQDNLKPARAIFFNIREDGRGRRGVPTISEIMRGQQ